MIFNKNKELLEALDRLQTQVEINTQAIQHLTDEILEEVSTLEDVKNMPTLAARVAALYNHFDFGLDRLPRSPKFGVRSTVDENNVKEG